MSQKNPMMELTNLITKYQLASEKSLLLTLDKVTRELRLDQNAIDLLKRDLLRDQKENFKSLLQDLRFNGTNSSSSPTDDQFVELMKAKQKIAHLESLLNKNNNQTSLGQKNFLGKKQIDDNQKKILQLELQIQKLRTEHEKKIIETIKSYTEKIQEKDLLIKTLQDQH